LEDCTRQIEQNPFANAYAQRGTVLHKLERYAEAIVDFTKAIELNPANAKALVGRASAHREKGNLAQAIEDYRQATEIRPTDSMSWLRLLDFEFARGASQETTQKLLAEAEAAGGGDFVTFQHAAWNLLLNRRAEYEKICREAASKCADSENLREVELVARAAALTNEPVLPTEKLVEMASRVVEAAPTPWREHALGLCLLRDGQADAAIARFNSSLDQKRWNNGVQANWLGLAIAHAAEGRVSEAQDWLRKAQEWFAQNPLDPTSGLHPVDRIECQLLLREAEQLLGKADQPEDDTETEPDN
jgi:tetratricopeptide (TPR) repeat protein